MEAREAYSGGVCLPVWSCDPSWSRHEFSWSCTCVKIGVTDGSQKAGPGEPLLTRLSFLRRRTHRDVPDGSADGPPTHSERPSGSVSSAPGL